jgi:hypothetical protein
VIKLVILVPESDADLVKERPSRHFPRELLTPYEIRVRQLEAEGLTRSDAQGCADAEIMKGLL